MNLREVDIRIKPIIKILIAAILIGCFFPSLNFYFEIVKLVCFIGLWVLFVKYKTHIIKIAIIPFLILFNPIVPYELSRSVWLLLDVVLAIVLATWAILDFTLELDRKQA